jgi:hypothetical protein
VSFLTWAALAIGALVLAPVVAHLLRRRPPDEQPFAAVRLVPDSPAVAHRRAAIEDRALLAVRALAVVLLALLGATPFVQCSRLSLARPSGASVALAIVIDDSLSMRAPFGDDEQTRFARAHAAARELLSSMQAGDAVAVVLAGKPARVALAATTNIDAARGVIERVKQTDRGTDLDGAVKIAGETLRELEHVDKRVVVLSDLADGHADGPPLAAPQGTKLWVPLDDMPAARPDCAAVRADQTGTRVTVTVACSPAARDAEGGERRVEVRAGDRVIGEAGMHFEGDGGEVVVNLTEAPPEGVQIHAVLTGDDVIAENDGAPVVSRGGELTVGMVSNEPEVRAATGGPPPVEQAFDALDLGVLLRPLATVPDHPEELRAFGLLIIDDVSGFTPAQRRELADWVEDGGVLLLTLGPNAAAAPLGSAFTPMLPAVVRWQKPAPEGIDPSSDRMFGETASGMSALAPKGRAQLAIERPDELRRLASWKDGEPFLLEHRMGRGVAYSLTLPFATTESDLVLRPGFLAFLVRLTETARSLGGVARTPVGTSWQLDGFRDVEVAFVGDNDELSPLDLERGLEGRGRRTVPELAGLYQLKLDGNTAYRVASVDETEVDLRPRPVEEASGDTEMGGVSASVDVSAYVAVLLLALLLGELLLRLRAPRRPRDAAPASGAEAIG